ncbi:MAG: DUF4026 domain-containing protein [Planctomycetota bacterium]|nr:DUF4026 domain-containing protein [Planctomycetota bacterium]
MEAPPVHPAWRLDEPWPATLIGLLRGESAPEPDRVLAATASFIGEQIDVLELQPSPDEKRPWSLVVRIPGHELPVVVGCERTKRMDEVPPALREEVVASRWSVVVESLIDEARPLVAWSRLATILGSIEDVVAVLDATTGRWFDREEMARSVLDPDLGPPEDVLWRVQAVSDREDVESGTVWLHTRGLLRCGLPELELLEFPGTHLEAGVRLLDAAAGLLLEDGPPPPEVPYALGPDASVTLVPWAEVAATLDRESLGSDEDRAALSQETPNPLRARRAVLCDLEPRGSFRKIWTWPRSAIEVLERPEVAIYRSDTATVRSSGLARRRWPEVLSVLDRTSPSGELADDPVLLVGIPVGTDPEGRIEHGWLQVSRADDAGGSGLLLRPTLDGRSAGTVVDFTTDQLDGWRLVRGDVAIGPDDDSSDLETLLGRARS